MAPPLSRLDKIFFETMARIRQITYRADRIEHLSRILNNHLDDYYSDNDRVFSRTDNEYFIRRYQAELLNYGI